MIKIFRNGELVMKAKYDEQTWESAIKMVKQSGVGYEEKSDVISFTKNHDSYRVVRA